MIFKGINNKSINNNRNRKCICSSLGTLGPRLGLGQMKNVYYCLLCSGFSCGQRSWRAWRKRSEFMSHSIPRRTRAVTLVCRCCCCWRGKWGLRDRSSAHPTVSHSWKEATPLGHLGRWLAYGIVQFVQGSVPTANLPGGSPGLSSAVEHTLQRFQPYQWMAVSCIH